MTLGSIMPGGAPVPIIPGATSKNNGRQPAKVIGTRQWKFC